MKNAELKAKTLLTATKTITKYICIGSASVRLKSSGI